jgi:hypothetical protein
MPGLQRHIVRSVRLPPMEAVPVVRSGEVMLVEQQIQRQEILASGEEEEEEEQDRTLTEEEVIDLVV